MERSLLLGALVLGSLGWLVGLLLSNGPAASSRRPSLLAIGLSAVVLAAVAAMTFPGRAVWPAGQAWGRGLVLGGAASLLAAWAWLRAGPTVGDAAAIRRSVGAAGPLFASVVPVAAALLWLGAAIPDTLAGVAFGWFLVSLLLAAGSSPIQTPGAVHAQVPNVATGALVGTGFLVTLCATAALGHYRDLAGAPAARWTTSAVVLAAAVPLLMLLGGLFRRTGGASESARTPGTGGWILRLAVPSLLLIGLAQLIGAGILMQTRLVGAAGAGIAMVLLAWWLAAEPDAHHDRAAGPPAEHILPVLVGLAGVVAAFYTLTGYGVGVMLIAAWLPTGLIAAALPRPSGADTEVERLRPAGGSERMVQVVVFGVLLLVYRLFVQRFQDDLSGATLVDHFALFSMIAGVLLPALLSGMLGDQREGLSPAGRVGRLIAMILVAAAVPAAMLVLWGPRAGIGLLAGLALGTALYPGTVSYGWIALASALPMAQWTHQALQLALLTRGERMRLLLVLGAVIAVMILLTDIGTRIAATVRRRSTPPLGAGAQGGTRS